MAVSTRSVAAGLIGRDGELARLDAVLDRLRERGGSLVIRGRRDGTLDDAGRFVDERAVQELASTASLCCCVTRRLRPLA
jgi:hypothetical protein